MDDGRRFQADGPATQNARSPVFVLVRGMKMSDDFEDRRFCRDGTAESGTM